MRISKHIVQRLPRTSHRAASAEGQQRVWLGRLVVDQFNLKSIHFTNDGTLTTLRFPFHSWQQAIEPFLGLVVAVNKLNTELQCVSFVFGFPNFI